MKLRVVAALDRLASESWVNREADPEAIRRYHEIRSLTIAQLRDDTSTTTKSGRDRIGREWVGHFSDEWFAVEKPFLSPAQLALEEGMRPFVEALPGEDRVLVWLRYDRQRTLREIANEDLHVDHKTVHRRLVALHAVLRDAITRAFPAQPEVES